MNLSPEEAALFGETPAAPAADDWGWNDEPTQPAVTQPAPAAPAGSGLILPDCQDCGAALSPETGSKLRDGTWKHIGCGKGIVPAGRPPAGIPVPSDPVPAAFPATPEPVTVAAPAEAPKKRGRPPKAPAQEGIVFAQTAAVTTGQHVTEPAIQTLAPAVIRVELGPETLAILKALLGK